MEIIDAGIDIYTIKEFLGHSSIRMTEQYIKGYQQRLKNKLKEKLDTVEGKKIQNNLPYLHQQHDNQWVKNKIIDQFSLENNDEKL